MPKFNSISISGCVSSQRGKDQIFSHIFFPRFFPDFFKYILFHLPFINARKFVIYCILVVFFVCHLLFVSYLFHSHAISLIIPPIISHSSYYISPYTRCPSSRNLLFKRAQLPHAGGRRRLRARVGLYARGRHGVCALRPGTSSGWGCTDR